MILILFIFFLCIILSRLEIHSKVTNVNVKNLPNQWQIILRKTAYLRMRIILFIYLFSILFYRVEVHSKYKTYIVKHKNEERECKNFVESATDNFAGKRLFTNGRIKIINRNLWCRPTWLSVYTYFPLAGNTECKTRPETPFVWSGMTVFPCNRHNPPRE